MRLISFENFRSNCKHFDNWFHIERDRGCNCAELNSFGPCCEKECPILSKCKKVEK